MSCEGCGRDLQWTLKSEYSDKVEYRVCSNCLLGLTTRSLSPEVFKNFLKNGHSATEFMLHDDFYDEDGNAVQSYFESNPKKMVDCPECGGTGKHGREFGFRMCGRCDGTGELANHKGYLAQTYNDEIRQMKTTCGHTILVKENRRLI